MLSPDDEQLVQDDPKVPGLSMLLDAEAIWNVRDRLLWQEADHVSIEYLRYKPSTNCVVLLRAQFKDREEYAYAIAFSLSTRPKLLKISQRFGTNCVILSGALGVVALRFPADRRLLSLPKLSQTDSNSLLQRLLQYDNKDSVWSLTTLRYNPERRYVCKVQQAGRPPVVVKLYTDKSYIQARQAARSIAADNSLNSIRCIGHSNRHSALAFAWQDGVELTEKLDPIQFEIAGRTLCKLHNQGLAKLPTLSESTLISRLNSTQKYLRAIIPELGQNVDLIAYEIKRRLSFKDIQKSIAHGDLHLDQFVVSPGSVSLIDFDRACLAPSEWDIANLESDLYWREQQGQLGDQNASLLIETFLEGYQSTGGRFNRNTYHTLLALRTLETAVNSFRHRNKSWRSSARKSVQRASKYLQKSQLFPRSNNQLVTYNFISTSTARVQRVGNVVSFSEDTLLPWLPAALDFEQARERLWELVSINGEHKGIELLDIQLIRHKPGRRCLIEYGGISRSTAKPITILGKSEAKSRYQRRLDDQCLLWNAGFQFDSDDGISVARPWGVIPEWSMWFQEKVRGQCGTQALLGPKRIETAQRIGSALAKLHRINLNLPRSYCLADEKKLLADRLLRAAKLLPKLSERILAVLQTCLMLAEHIQEGTTTSIHRDFYPDQLVVSDNRIVLVDFDLLCRGDAGLDIGNFIGHLEEMAVRDFEIANRYNEVAEAFLSTYRHHAPEIDLRQIDAYSIFTSARHIFINARIERRSKSVESLLEYIEQELAHLLDKYSMKVS